MAHHSQEALGKFSYEVVPQLSSEDSFPTMRYSAESAYSIAAMLCTVMTDGRKPQSFCQPLPQSELQGPRLGMSFAPGL